MANAGEKILVVESDPDISDLIARQALQPLGYQVAVAGDASTAIRQTAQFTPDLIIASLDLPGLSGKDLLVALKAQGLSAPVVMLTGKGQERDVIQAFRLGAADYVSWPARDAEVVAVVERALQQTREARARRQLDRQLDATSQELQQRVRDLTMLLALGKSVATVTDQRELFVRAVEAAVALTGADLGWLTLRDERSKNYLMVTHKGLPDGWARKINQPVDDGVGALVALSGETLSMHGQALERFKVSGLGKSCMAVPIKIRQDVIGLLIVVRAREQAFDQTEQTLLEAVADYAAIALINARLFRALESGAETARSGEKRQNALLQSLRETLREELGSAFEPLDLLLTGKPGRLNHEQKQALETAHAALQRLTAAAEKTIPPVTAPARPE